MKTIFETLNFLHYLHQYYKYQVHKPFINSPSHSRTHIQTYPFSITLILSSPSTLQKTRVSLLEKSFHSILFTLFLPLTSSTFIQNVYLLNQFPFIHPLYAFILLKDLLVPFLHYAFTFTTPLTCVRIHNTIHFAHPKVLLKRFVSSTSPLLPLAFVTHDLEPSDTSNRI